jgi:hypothetical protein
MNSGRLLRGMHKVYSHDLPNQMVALQCLLQLLQAEEAEHLGVEGQEYVRRLQNVTQRACEQVRFLKEMGRINTCSAKSETISLSALARELQGELQQKHPHKQFVFEWQWQAPAITGDARTFLLALSELCAGFLPTLGKRCRLSARSERRGAAIEVVFDAAEVPGPKNMDPTALPPRWSMHNLKQRMEVTLAREWLALSEAELEVTLPSVGSARFSIVIPNR